MVAATLFTDAWIPAILLLFAIVISVGFLVLANMANAIAHAVGLKPDKRSQSMPLLRPVERAGHSEYIRGFEEGQRYGENSNRTTEHNAYIRQGGYNDGYNDGKNAREKNYNV
jgi:hypothetical protein